MKSIEEVRRILGDDTLSDEEVEAIRDAAYELASIIIDHWITQHQVSEASDSAE